MNERFNRWMGAYRTAALVLLNCVVVFLVLNVMVWLGLRLANAFAPPSNVVVQKYGDAELVSVYPGMAEADIRRLLDECWKLQRGFQPYVHFREVPFTGRFVNVHPAGFRRSADQAPWPPDREAFNVFFFGGSTTFAYGLADGDSVPSQLQRALRERGHRRVAVYNFGAGSYQSTQEKIHFSELLVDGYRPQMAIFLDGLNEFAFPHVPQDTDLLRQQLGDKRALRLRALASVLDGLPLAQLARAMMRSAHYPAGDPSSVPGRTETMELAESVSRRYLENLRQIAAMSRSAGVVPVFVWQPTPYYRYDATHHPFYERGGVNRHASAGYGRMREIIAREPPQAPFFWAADIQEHLREPLYVDSVHYTAAMARRLAEWIADRLVDGHLLDPFAQ